MLEMTPQQAMALTELPEALRDAGFDVDALSDEQLVEAVRSMARACVTVLRGYQPYINAALQALDAAGNKGLSLN